jgi:hypothetical protein
MSKTNATGASWLELLLNNVAFDDVGDASGLQPSGTAGNLYLSLHTSDPGETGSQTTNEIGYSSYGRVAVARTGAVWTVTVADPASAELASPPASFPAGDGGSGTATHFGLGTASAGAGVLLYSGAITPNIVCGDGITPQISPTITED